MPAVVADTHALIWYLANDPRLSAAAGAAMDEAGARGDAILVSASTLVELTYLVEKGRLSAIARQRLVNLLADSAGPFQLAPLDAEIAAAVERVDRHLIPDLPDRVIAATAIAWNSPLVSRDERIRASEISTVW
jgi:PIN domain nuclease of toxin-antitoxin system